MDCRGQAYYSPETKYAHLFRQSVRFSSLDMHLFSARTHATCSFIPPAFWEPNGNYAQVWLWVINATLVAERAVLKWLPGAKTSPSKSWPSVRLFSSASSATCTPASPIIDTLSTQPCEKWASFWQDISAWSRYKWPFCSAAILFCQLALCIYFEIFSAPTTHWAGSS